jgi:hypothetical protein
MKVEEIQMKNLKLGLPSLYKEKAREKYERGDQRIIFINFH